MQRLKRKNTDDKWSTLFQICEKYQYPLEKFMYETSDGYYNTVFHINGDRYTDAKTNSLNYNQKL